MQKLANNWTYSYDSIHILEVEQTFGAYMTMRKWHLNPSKIKRRKKMHILDPSTFFIRKN